ncbi:hypothetical protein BMS3Abin09_00598 [bacterium BMS3Abin09]|nr:hypothetical protein BMS3Abin09_00598 [bacterium BMS3Abin09]
MCMAWASPDNNKIVIVNITIEKQIFIMIFPPLFLKGH